MSDIETAMSRARGWAVATISDNRILVATVSEHRRAAMVNWLVAYRDVLVTKEWSDRRISQAFEAIRGGCVRLVEVDILEALP